MLELLDERERNQQYIKRRDQENEDIALTVGKLRVELETAKSKLNEQREYYEGVISDGSKRIAKLESNEVREDGNQFLVVRHPGKTPVIKHCTGDLEEFLRQQFSNFQRVHLFLRLNGCFRRRFQLFLAAAIFTACRSIIKCNRCQTFRFTDKPTVQGVAINRAV